MRTPSQPLGKGFSILIKVTFFVMNGIVLVMAGLVLSQFMNPNLGWFLAVFASFFYVTKSWRLFTVMIDGIEKGRSSEDHLLRRGQLIKAYKRAEKKQNADCDKIY